MYPAGIAKTFATTDSAMATNDAENGYDIGTAVTYCIAGLAYEKATVDDGTVPTSDGDGVAIPTLAVDKGCAYVWTLDAAGTVDLWAGDPQSLDESGNFIVAPEFPHIDLDLYCPIGYTIVKNASSAAITIGTTNWNATDVTTTTTSVLVMPSRPKVA